MSRIGRAVWGLAVVAVCAVAPAEAAEAADETKGPACEVAYLPSPHSGGFTANVTLRNTGGVTISGWTFVFPVIEGVEVVDFWEAELVSPTGMVIARNAPHNPVLGPDSSLTIGFLAKGPAEPHPSSFAINGVECAVAPRA